MLPYYVPGQIVYPPGAGYVVAQPPRAPVITVQPPAGSAPAVKATPAAAAGSQAASSAASPHAGAASPSAHLASSPSGDKDHSEDPADEVPAGFNNRKKRASLVQPTDINVLVVDDENVTRHVVSGYLRKSNYKQVMTAENGVKAWELLKANPDLFQLVLCDVNMPEMDGLELLKKVREDPTLRDLPFLMMSATEQLDIAIQCTRQGADDFLLKPVRLPVVRNIWQNVWRKRRERQFADAIEQEQFRRRNMETEMESLTSQIHQLKAQVSEAIETPFQVISTTITDLIKKDDLRGEVKVSLLSILKQLSSSRLHQPAFSKLLNEDSELNVTTRMWLTDQLQETTQSSDAAHQQIVFAERTPQSGPEPDDPSHDIGSWDFDIFNFSEDDFLPLIIRVYKEFDLFDRFNIELTVFGRFLHNVKEGYPKGNPFHNFRHAFDVFQMVYLLLTKGGAAALLTSLEIFSLLTATLVHDVEHPGLNNQFQIIVRSPLAMHYNDRSVLENYHCSRGFHILTREGGDIVAQLEAADFRQFRAQVISNILATDLANHVQLLNQFKTITPEFSRENKEHRRLLTDIILKVADISNGCRPFRVAKIWSDLVQEEFFTQGDLEKERELAVSPFMDRENKAQTRMALNFGDYLVLPLMEAFSELFPNMKICCTRLLSNRSEWEALHEQSEAAAQ